MENIIVKTCMSKNINMEFLWNNLSWFNSHKRKIKRNISFLVYSTIFGRKSDIPIQKLTSNRMHANTSNIVLLLNMHFINKKLINSEICCLILYKFLIKNNSKSYERVENFVMKSHYRVMYQKSRKKYILQICKSNLNWKYVWFTIIFLKSYRAV